MALRVDWVYIYKRAYQSCFSRLGAAGMRNKEESRLRSSLPAEEVQWAHMVLHGVRQPWTMLGPTTVS